jgi:hypothetical protein
MSSSSVTGSYWKYILIMSNETDPDLPKSNEGELDGFKK